jgi:hypothetical protein
MMYHCEYFKLTLPAAKVLLFLGISGEPELKQKAVPTE